MGFLRLPVQRFGSGSGSCFEILGAVFQAVELEVGRPLYLSPHGDEVFKWAIRRVLNTVQICTGVPFRSYQFRPTPMSFASVCSAS